MTVNGSTDKETCAQYAQLMHMAELAAKRQDVENEAWCRRQANALLTPAVRKLIEDEPGLLQVEAEDMDWLPATVAPVVAAYGKWNVPDFPRSGWTYERGRDLGEFEALFCEICENERAQYVHQVMHHAYAPRGLWADLACALQLCPDRVNAIRGVHEKLQTEAAEKRSNSVTVAGCGCLICPPEVGLPQYSPLITFAGRLASFSVLPWPKACKIHFQANWPCWTLGGDTVATLYPVAMYWTDPLDGKHFSDRHPRILTTPRFGAILLRDCDREALRKLCPNQIGDYTVSWEIRRQPIQQVTWVRSGAATWRDHERHLFERAFSIFDDEGSWDLSKVLYLTSTPDMDPVMHDYAEL